MTREPQPAGQMKTEDMIILGGGLAGLAASAFSGAPIYEAGETPGGVACSDEADGFVFDRGIHILQTTNPFILNLLGKLGVEFERHRRNAFIYSHKTYTPYPFQINTAGLPFGLRARCVRDFCRRDVTARPANYEQWIYRNLGKGFGDTFLIPYSEKFWTVAPRLMTFEWAGSRVPQPSLSQVVRGALWSRNTPIGSNAEFLYPSGPAGFGAIAQALAGRCGTIHTGHRACLLNAGKRQVWFGNGVGVRYDTLINTIPLPELIGICEDAPEYVRAAAAKLRANSILVVNLGIDRPNLSDRHWVHFPEKDISFFRISFPNNFSTAVVPQGTSSVSAEVAYSESCPIDTTTIVDHVIEDLIRVGVLSRRERIVIKTTCNISRAYCIYDWQRKEGARPVLAWLKSVGIVSGGRYGLWAYFWSDQAILSGKKAAERVLARSMLSAG